MGRFSATLLLLLGACGDNVDGEGLPPGPGQDVFPDGNGTATPRYVPQVCGVASWSTDGDARINLSVAQGAEGGATFLTAPIGGGQLSGFTLNTREDIVSGEETRVPVDGSFESVSVTYVQGLPVSTAIAGTTISVHQLDPSFEFANLMTQIKGTHVSEPAFFRSSGNLVMPVAGEDGLTVHRFYDSLEPLDSKTFVTTKPATSFAAAQVGAGIMSAWSTDTECYLHMTHTYEPGETARIVGACPGTRLSYNQKSGEGIMLFDSPEGIRLMSLYQLQQGGHPVVIRADATSPRTVFDGTNFWVSYLDERGDVGVGFLDASYRPVTIALGAMNPGADAYELTMIDGAPWVFTLDDSGYTGYKLCVGED